MDSIRTKSDLVEALKLIYSRKENDSPENYRYAIYARKSTDDSEKQVRSLDDQIAVCKEYAEKNDLRIVSIIRESESAKEPDIRPRFREMLTLLSNGKLDGILSWHPDRLARNMKDAGEVIDLVDKQIIKSLKFVSFTFENNTSGKMLLGMTFVLSKQYSDHLSDSVSRGNQRSVAEGKYINKPKHGYFKDKNQLLRPDGHNFTLIKNAFDMRKDGRTMPEIVQYLNKNGYYRSNKLGSKKYFKMDIQKAAKFLKDPVYTGVLIYGKSGIVDLTKLYDFVPMIEVEDFLRINKLTGLNNVISLSQQYKKGDSIKADLMRGMVICSECGEFMSAGITPKKTKKGVTNYFYYRCDTDDCDRFGKSVRAKVLTEFIYAYLNTKPFSTVEAYSHYKEEMVRIGSIRHKEALGAIGALQASKRKLTESLEKTKTLLLNEDDQDNKRFFSGDLKKIDQQIKDTEENIVQNSRKLAQNKNIMLTYAEFLELWENMASNMKKIEKMSDLDFVIKKIFLNFTIKENEVVKYTLNVPFDVLETTKVLDCAG